MIAMQYSFALPADYDMDIVDRRIRDKGPLLDNFPNLVFKAYLTARKGDATTGSRDNLYAPLYVWNGVEGLNDFLCGPGFAGVSAAFGRPQVNTWILWKTAIAADVRKARFATREISDIGLDADLGKMRAAGSADALADIETGAALASVSAFDPDGWKRLRFRLWREMPQAPLPTDTLAYRLGHLSLPERACPLDADQNAVTGTMSLFHRG
ncbi:DUF4865 family protein [Rhizobium sp. L80/93]|uniref:DUF4865 family protein n=1 Tax=unclassified Rhizobium TaxID=2613769 RepID=UPI001ADAEB31|nr:DUF4865 family protein [Rhizobium sp. B21/90]MBO9169683.1 DUF4865 family protein [Rhizobium sp. L245/93]MBO9185641.1 DUF4865 family protein [Rhizobium sp. E27B/91]QYA02617.1 DUF4865 family protein [Rhizobium sp. B21/90]